MGAVSASVIGGPLTMSFIALETTGNLWLTTAALVAVIISTQLTRELFGYSFATWRFHLRGETIRSAAEAIKLHDILHYPEAMLRPDQNVQDAVAAFDRAEAESLAVVDTAEQRRVIGLLTEAHALRRYSEESERRRREAVGEM
ncbi:hypothetical protein [Bradyrhizobium prioriisuperbiae]|uniref:hypothetical protein n=1 Tax=Bradyrhizobium prioriisuperbiae TaxID=2854389 RepID=UPI0028ECB367|nr:hypothetical protein [Bradyrhizobium prioritasuperba]